MLFVLCNYTARQFELVKGYERYKMGKVKSFLERKNIEIKAKRYFIDAMGAMALGLFATLLIGTIFGTLGDSFSLAFCTDIKNYAQAATGMAIGVAIAYALKAPALVIYSCAVVGHIGNSFTFTFAGETLSAGPAGAFFAVIIACEIGKIVSKETPVDILLTPVVTILSGYAVSLLVCPAVSVLIYYLAEFIGIAMAWAPLLMGVVVAMIVGMILTLPISSAALCAMIFNPAIIESSANSEAMLLAGGAAAVGCCAQMVGFAAISFRENKWGGLVAQGLGTSMLQMGNICRKPQIWIAPTLAGGLCGALSAVAFHLKCSGVSAGMGTCGLVGPIGIFASSGYSLNVILGTFTLCLLLPAVASFAFNELLRKAHLVKTGDMKLDI